MNVRSARFSKKQKNVRGAGELALAAVPGTLRPVAEQLQQIPAGGPVEAYLAGLAPRSRYSMLSALSTVAALITRGPVNPRDFPWQQLRRQHLAWIQQELLTRGKAPATVNTHLAAVRGALKGAWELGLISGDEYQRAISLRAIRNQRLPAGRALAVPELTALVRACLRHQDAEGIRDAALIAVAYATGARRAELAALELRDWTPRDGSLRVLGKGNRERLAWLSPGARRLLDGWLEVRGRGPGPLFAISDQDFYWILRRRVKEAGLQKVTPHDLRRTALTHLLERGVDLLTVSRAAGHSLPQTTARYDRRPDSAVRDAVQGLEIPLDD